jgi:transposase-like protein
MGRKPSDHAHYPIGPVGSIAALACPNPDRLHFNRFGARNFSVVEWPGKHKHIRSLYCSACKRRFTERQGTLLRSTKLLEGTVVRLVKCLGHGCSVEATADICYADPRTVDCLLEQAGRRTEDFHRLQLERLAAPPEGAAPPVRSVVSIKRRSTRSAPRTSSTPETRDEVAWPRQGGRQGECAQRASRKEKR